MVGVVTLTFVFFPRAWSMRSRNPIIGESSQVRKRLTTNFAAIIRVPELLSRHRELGGAFVSGTGIQETSSGLSLRQAESQVASVRLHQRALLFRAPERESENDRHA